MFTCLQLFIYLLQYPVHILYILKSILLTYSLKETENNKYETITIINICEKIAANQLKEHIINLLNR